MLLIVGIIHLLPLSGVLSANRLQMLYGIAVEDPNLEILMRHRAVLFGLLGAFLIAAAFLPSLQLAALAAGFVSVVSFLYLAAAVGNFNEQVNRVVIADKVAVICLVVGAVAYVMSRLNADQI
jgi:hypothetical protein